MPTATEPGTSPDAASRDADQPDHAGRALEPAAGDGTPTEDFLAAPAPLEGRRRRVHRVVIALLMLLCVGRGLQWSVTVVVWSPIDELQHFGYIESLATGHGIPTVGHDLISDEAMATIKQSPTAPYRSEPYPPDNTDPYWGGTRHQYEAVHGPTYYALMVPAYWAGKPFGELGALYAVRFATAALMALIVPLTWLLGRRLFPDRPGVALGAAALIAVLNSLVPGQVGNDGLAMVLATVTILAAIRACNDARRWRWPLAAGALFGLTMVTKSNSLVIIPFVGLMVAGWIWSTRPGWARVGRLAAGVAAGSVATFAPWLAWNLHAYGAPTASGATGEITSPYMTQETLGLAGVWAHGLAAHKGVWISQLTQSVWYPRAWELAFAVALVAGAAAIATRRRWRDLAVFLWCASAVPGAFLAMEVLVFTLFGGVGGPVGRHLIAGLPPTMIMLAAAVSFVVGARLLPVVLAWCIAGALVMDAQLASAFVRGIYQPLALHGTWGPVVYQDWADTTETGRDAVVLDGGCAADWVGVGFTTPPGSSPPPQVTVTTESGETLTAPFVVEFGFMPLYRLPRSVEGPLTVAVPDGAVMRSSTTERSAAVGYLSGGNEPVASLYCRTDDPFQTSFAVRYPVGHPDVGSAMLTTTPFVVAGGAVAVAAGLTGWTLVGGADRSRRRRDDESAGPADVGNPETRGPGH